MTEAHANACVDHDLAAMLATRLELRCVIAKALEAARGPTADQKAAARERQFARDYLDDLTRTVKP